MSFFDTLNLISSYIFSITKGTILASTAVSVILSGLLYFKQTSLIYPRNLPEGARTEVPRPDQFGIDEWAEVDLRTSDDEVLKSYFLKASRRLDQGVTVLFLHGNAGNIGHRLPIARVFSEQMGCNVFMLGYRGYGLSTGRPSEKGLLIDAQAALDWILTNDATKNTKVFVYGQSLGGALSIQLVSRNQRHVHGLILENTFRSMRTLIPSAFPPAKYLARFCHQIWPSEDTIPKIKDIPVLFLSGLKDELIPPAHMKALHNACTTTKVWRELPNGSHNDTCGEAGYFEYIFEFISAVKAGSSHVERLVSSPRRSFSSTLSSS